MNLTYPEIFAQRGNRYDAAMRQCPNARRNEFETLFAGTPVKPGGRRVLDIPAGGGYMSRYLPDGTELVSLELTPGFGAGVPVYSEVSPWAWGRFDHIVCLAALHHIANQTAFIGMLVSHLSDSGVLHLADVPNGSGISRFLDGFVDSFNGTGHRGTYLSADQALFESLGDVKRLEERECPWCFESDRQMSEFCMELFGLSGCNEKQVVDALDEYIGIDRTATCVRLKWRLLYVDIARRT